VLDNYSHFVWTFLLFRKSDVLPTLISFHAFVQTQFCRPILAFQSDNGGKFDNKAFGSFLAARGIALCLTCPHTSQQNGRAERLLRTLNDSVCTMLLHAAMVNLLARRAANR
jgi:transposase InsO family protein